MNFDDLTPDETDALISVIDLLLTARHWVVIICDDSQRVQAYWDDMHTVKSLIDDGWADYRDYRRRQEQAEEGEGD